MHVQFMTTVTNRVHAGASRRSLARLSVAAIALLTWAVAGAQGLPVQQLTVAFTNAFPNASVDSLTMPNSMPAIVKTNPLLTGGTPSNLYTALTWVTNPATSTLDVIYADAEQHKIWRLPGPLYKNPVVIFFWSAKTSGPAYPVGLAADPSGNVYVISPSSSWGNSGVWVLPFDAAAQTYYDPPRLIDNTFTDPSTHKPVLTLALTEVLVAGSAGSTWSAGDLLVLVADLYDTRVIHYTQAQIQSVLPPNPPPPKGLIGPNSTVVTAAQFSTQAIKKIPPVPVGMDIGQNPTTPGDATLLFSTVGGSILDFDSDANEFTTTPYAINLGLGLTRLKVGTFQATQYVFVGQLPGRILEFAALTSGGSNTLATAVASVSTGVNNPTGLATTNSGSIPAASCVPGSFTGSITFTGSMTSSVLSVSAPSGPAIAVGQTIAGAGIPAGTTIVSFGTGTGGTGTYDVTAGTPSVGSEAMTNVGCAITPQFSLAITGQTGSIPATASIAADSCTFIDTRVTSPGLCPVATTLDIGSVCANMPHVTLPATICGGWGVTGASISVTKVSAATVNQNINNTLTRFVLNPTIVLPPVPGALNPVCGNTNGPIAAWGPVPEVESPIPEGTLIDITVACTTDPPPAGDGNHPSIVVQGTVNAPLTAVYVGGEFNNLQTAFTDITTGPQVPPFPQPSVPAGQPAPAMQIVDPTGKVVPTIQGFITNSLNFFSQAVAAGTPPATAAQDYNCALNTLWQGTQYVNTLANTAATSGDFIAGPPPYDQNPSGTLLMRFDHLYYDVYIYQGIATTGMSPPALTTDALNLTAAQVPACNALNQPSGLAFSPNNNSLGYLYVANYGSGQVLVYAPVGPNGQMVQQPAMTINGMINPSRLAFAPISPASPSAIAGYLFVADDGATNGCNTTEGCNTVAVFNPNGSQAGVYGTIFGLTRPLGVAADLSGLVYVAENYGANGNNPAVEDIRVFAEGEGWDNCATFTQDSREQQFNTIGALAYNGTDLLVGLPNQVNYYPTANLGASPDTCESEFPDQFPPPAPDPGQVSDTTNLNGVIGIAIDPTTGNVDVTNYYISTTPPVVPAFVQFAPSTGAQTTVTLTGTPNPIGNPQGVAVDASGNIYVADAANNVIYVYNSTGAYWYTIH
jgi:hypothetical protein